MSDTKEPGPDELSAAHAAMSTAELARINIEHYLHLHGGGAAKFVMKISQPNAHFVMKIADEADAGIAKIVDDSAALAARTLQAFVDKRKKG